MLPLSDGDRDIHDNKLNLGFVHHSKYFVYDLGYGFSSFEFEDYRINLSIALNINSVLKI